jgi:hypothetical protein
MGIGAFASVALILLTLAYTDFDLGAVMCFGIALVSALVLFAFCFVRRGRQRLAALLVVMTYVAALILLMSNYSLVRDHVRWALESRKYKVKVLAQNPGEGLKHAEWDGWGFAGADTTEFLVFDPNNSLAAATESRAPVKMRSLPCDVVRVRRLENQWYAVLFYTDTYWGQGACK